MTIILEYNKEKWKGCERMASAERIIGYTVEDIYNLPEGQRAELIEGELYMMRRQTDVTRKL